MNFKNAFLRTLVTLYEYCRAPQRNFILRIVRKIDGGEMYSSWLRNIFEKYHGITVGYGSYGSCFKVGSFQNGTVIGRYCSLASDIKRFNANHPTEYFSMHPLFYNPVAGAVKKDSLNRNVLTIGNDVWIGYHVTILSDVTYIGTGAVIGACSVVTKNVGDYEIVVGNPAKFLRHRFSPEIKDSLLKSNWWDLDKDTLFNKKDDIKKLVGLR